MKAKSMVARHYATGQPVRIDWDSDQILSVAPAADAPPDLWIAPGLVDLQINGYAGVDFQQDNLGIEPLLHAARELRRSGCTRFFFTLITEQWDILLDRLARARGLSQQSPELRRAIAGWHLEGPFLSELPGFHGAHDPACMVNPAPAHIRRLREICGADPLLLTVAPERPGAIAAIAEAAANDCVVSLGHTNASAAELRQASAAGATGFTHLGNGIPRELDRHDNILWRVLDSARFTVSLIADGIHLSPQLFRLIHRLQSPDRIFYTTDAMSAAGAPPGIYPLGQLRLEVGSDQVVRQPGKTNFAGSALRPLDAIRRASAMLESPWQSIWPAYSTVPANFARIQHGLEPGNRSDFLVIRTEAGLGVEEPGSLT